MKLRFEMNGRALLLMVLVGLLVWVMRQASSEAMPATEEQPQREPARTTYFRVRDQEAVSSHPRYYGRGNGKRKSVEEQIIEQDNEVYTSMKKAAGL